jgi:hypothetical protein
MVKAVAEQSGNRRILVWSADAGEQQELETLSVGGALPATPGPFAMAVVNNGGGNKLDAYLKVHVGYDPGQCIQRTRFGALAVQLTNTAPSKGLAEYQTERNDLRDDGITRFVPGSNRIVLDLYGPVGARAPLITLDGSAITPMTTGTDRGHSVWRVVVPILPGQQRTIQAVVIQPISDGDGQPHVQLQPMAIPQTATMRPVEPCGS